MEILQLRYFMESAKSENFAKVAEKYGVPATSVSASVKRLEKELGCPLFDRKANKITLNEKGREFYNSLIPVFRQLNGAVEKMKNSTVDTRPVRILVRALRKMLSQEIINYKKLFPETVFHTLFDPGNVSFEDYDIIIDVESNRYKNYEYFDYKSFDIGIRALTTHPLFGKKLKLKDLKNESFVTMGENNAIHHLFVEACKKAGFTPNITIRINDLSCLIDFLYSGLVLGVIRKLPSNRNEKADFLDVTDFNVKQNVRVYYKKSSAYGNVANFLEFIKNR